MVSGKVARRSSIRKAAHGLVLLSALGLTAPTAALANGGKGAPRGGEQPRPVARLIGTVYSEPTARIRERQVARASVPAATPSYASAPAAGASGEERRAFDLINAERQRRGVRPLAWDGGLTRLARYHSQNMAQGGYLNHVDRQGLDLKARAHAVGLRGWSTLGENIAYNQGYPDPAAFAVERWMISHKHRENAMNADYTHAAVGIARAADGTYYFTQVFMKR